MPGELVTYKILRMRKVILLMTIGIVLTFKLEARKTEGKIIFEHDTIDVVFNIPIRFLSQEPNYEKLQQKVKYFDAAGKKISLHPDEAKEIQFKYENENIRMLSRYNSLGLGNIFMMGTNIFLKLEIDGNLKLFRYYYSQRTPGTYNASSGMMTCGFSIVLRDPFCKRETGN